jgi:hypothetical protein
MSQAPIKNRVTKRNQMLEKWEYYLSESVYYRTFSVEMKTIKNVLFTFSEKQGRCQMP